MALKCFWFPETASSWRSAVLGSTTLYQGVVCLEECEFWPRMSFDATSSL